MKMRATSKSYSLKIATHASYVIVFFGALSIPPSTDTNGKGIRTPSFKHASLDSIRDASARKSSVCEAAELFSCFLLQIAMYVDPL